jgi:uncharacterized protein
MIPDWIDTPTLMVGGALLAVLSTSLLPLLVSAIHKVISTLQLRYILWQQQQQQNDADSIVGTVSGVYVHPVKSMRAVSLENAALDAKGLVDDRRFMVVYEVPLPAYKTEWDAKDTRYRFLTQRQCPSLATITATLTENALILEVSSPTNKKRSNRRMEISWNASVKNSSATPTHFLAGIWDDTILVQDMGDSAASFLQEIVNADEQSTLGEQCKVRLVRHSINDRAADPSFTPPYAKTWWGSTPLVSLTDGYPILIASESSLDDVNEKLKQVGKDTIPMSRFRPNIVLRGDKLQPFEEDRWKVIAIGDVLFAIVKACPRCKQSCTDQTTGKVTEEPVGIMKSFRALGDETSDDVFFAQNAIPFLGPRGKQSIKVGDPVRVLKRGNPIYK